MEPRNHYPPLPQSPAYRAFRLLVLEPGEGHEDIVCQLQIINPDDAIHNGRFPIYDAVSYAWGETTPDHEILLGAWQVLVRENLWQLLKHLRHPRHRAVYWVDALCIDQSRHEERVAQVQMMDEIYKRARCVIVWLGLPLADGLPAMKLVDEVAARGFRQHETNSSSDFEALSSWAHRPYWSRTWVVQEFLLASDVVFQCGTIRMKWSCMSRFIHAIEREIDDGLNKRLEYCIMFRNSPAYILMQQRAHGSKFGLPLIKLLVRNQHTFCQDPCDKVYAVLGLSDAPRGIQISYTLNRRRLAHDVLRDSKTALKDTVRYASFLSDLLELEPRVEPHSAIRGIVYPSREKEYDIWTIPCYTVGEIVSSDPLDVPLALKVPALLQRILTPGFTEPKTNTRSGDTEQLTHRLHGFALDDLCSDFKLLEAISQRMWPSKSIQTTAAALQATACASLITVMTSSCAHREILIGVAYGRPRAGDKVVYALGHTVAFLLSRPDARSDHRRVSGTLVCVSPLALDVTRDRITQKILQAFNIQSEADLQGHAEQTDLKVTTAELFAFASGDRCSC